MKHTTTRTLTVLIGAISVTRECKATFVYDAHYGADADGNRGMGCWMMDEFEIMNPSDKSDGGFTLSGHELAQAEEKLEEAMTEVDFESEIDYGPDPDDDYPDERDYDGPLHPEDGRGN